MTALATSAEVRVTAHALTRWRQRASDYADASAWDLVQVFRRCAVLVRQRDYLPFRRFPETTYYRIGDCFAACVQCDGQLVVVTVLIPGEGNQTARLQWKRESA